MTLLHVMSVSVGVVFLLLCQLTVFKFLGVRLIKPQNIRLICHPLWQITVIGDWDQINPQQLTTLLSAYIYSVSHKK